MKSININLEILMVFCQILKSFILSEELLGTITFLDLTKAGADIFLSIKLLRIFLDFVQIIGGMIGSVEPALMDEL